MKVETKRDYRQRIAHVVEAILLDPGKPHTLESLAAIAHLSPFHFHRVYRVVTGESVGETVRRIRVAQAAHRLARPDARVTDVALDVGYGSPQTFTRAFRGFAGLTPSEFQARQNGLAWAMGAPADVTITELRPCHALCLRHEGPIATIPHTFNMLLGLLCCERRAAGVGPLIGIGSGDPQRGTFQYLAGIVPSLPLHPVKGIERVRIDGGVYAAYRLIGPYELIAATFRTLFQHWLPQSAHEFDGRPTVEVYRNWPESVPPSERVTDLLIPTRNRRMCA